MDIILPHWTWNITSIIACVEETWLGGYKASQTWPAKDQISR